MLGAIAGDVIGSLHEGTASPGRHFTLFAPRSCFTDDSVLTIAIAHALRLDLPYDTALRQWARRYPTAGYGAGFQRWFESDKAGPYNSFGNGSAMRVAPIAWAFDSMEEVIRRAEQSAAVTHSHPEGIRGAAAIAAAIFLARTGTGKEALAAWIHERFGYNCRISLQELQQEGGFDITCQATVPAALGAFMHSRDFEDAVRIAVSLGGDTDTLACIAGAVAEAHYGGLPLQIQTEALRRLDEPLREEVRLFAEHYRLVHLSQAFPALHRPRSVNGVPSGVLVEGTSVIVRIDAIHRRLRGGWRTFLSMVPNQTLCCDMELARVGFMGDEEAKQFAQKLEHHGLEFVREGHAIDIALACHARKLLTPCDWLTLHDVKLTSTGSRVLAGSLKGTEIRQVAVPEGWKYRDSLSQICYLLPPASPEEPDPQFHRVHGGPE